MTFPIRIEVGQTYLDGYGRAVLVAGETWRCRSVYWACGGATYAAGTGWFMPNNGPAQEDHPRNLVKRATDA